MKKQTLMAVIAAMGLCVGSAHAAIISWGATTGSTSGFTGSYGLGDTICLIWDVAGDGIDQITGPGSYVAGDDKIALQATLLADGSYSSGSVTFAPGSVFAGVTTASTPGPYTTFTPLYVVVYDTGSASTFKHYLVSTASGKFTVNTSTIPTSHARGNFTELVPEPATLTLALVGAGALALRRRFGKRK